jgi:hypothetical protein
LEKDDSLSMSYQPGRQNKDSIPMTNSVKFSNKPSTFQEYAARERKDANNNSPINLLRGKKASIEFILENSGHNKWPAETYLKGLSGFLQNHQEPVESLSANEFKLIKINFLVPEELTETKPKLIWRLFYKDSSGNEKVFGNRIEREAILIEY